MNSNRALVLETDSQAALAVVRSLGSRGVPVTAGGTSRWALGMLSRYSDDAYVYPDPMEDGKRFLRHLRRHLEGHDYVAVFATSDHLSALLSRHKADLERTGTAVGVEDWERFRPVFDKAELFETLRDVDVPRPETRAPSSLSAAEAMATEIAYPVVVKPRSKTVWDDGWRTVSHHRVSDENYVTSPGDLVEAYRQTVDADGGLVGYPPLVQEYVPGQTTTTVVLADEGRIVAHFQERRLRTTPHSGGNSTLLAAERDPQMLAYAERVVGALDWTGPAMVEFMETPAGEHYLIEVNGRYWGSLPFATSAGVDFPWLHYRQLQGAEISGNPTTYRTDVVQRRLLYGDVKWLVERLSDGHPGALLPFVRSFFTADHTFVSPEDPLPTLGALAEAPVMGTRWLGERVTGGSLGD